MAARNVCRRIVGMAATVATAVLLTACGEPEGELSFTGPEQDLLNAEALADLHFTVEATLERDVSAIALRHNGDAVEPTEEAAQVLRWKPTQLDDGHHTVTVEQVDTDEPTVLQEWTFAVDATPPKVEITEPSTAVVAGEPVSVIGTTEPDATVAISGDETVADADGRFELVVDDGLAGEHEVTVTDAAGNRSTHPLAVLTVPSRVEIDEIRAVHVTSHAWAHDGLRSNVLQMIADGKINAVQLDLKDESGQIGYDSQVPLAQQTGAARGVYDLDEAVAELHDLGVPIVGRIVAFRDGQLGQYAIDHGRLDWLIQTRDGQPYTGRYECCFGNFANDEVIAYNLDIAEEAAAAGVDSILWDYIRRPDGPVENLRFPGIGDRTPEEAVAAFTQKADERLAPYGVLHGVSVYGIASTRPTQIGQDIPAMAEHVDFVAPMVYPSHWGPGEYDVADPNRQPFDIVSRSLVDFQTAVEGTGARVIPWLEDTAYRAWDRPTQIREQIRGAASIGIDEWMMWDPNVRYTPDAYPAR